MKVIKGEAPKSTYPHDPIWSMDFELYADKMRDGYLFVADSYDELFTGKYNDKEKIFLTLEEPNFCTDADNQHARLSNYADTILTICPYTAMADLSGKRKNVFLPYPENHIQKDFVKIYDVIYSGSYPQVSFWPSLMRSVQEYKHVDIQYRRGNFANCTYAEKIKLYSQSKIAIIHNTSPVGNYKERFKAFPNARNNRAFDWLDFGLLPQIKTRTIEAAFNKCIILCLRDAWNIIEQYFEYGKDFLYFDKEREGIEIINEILLNYENYKPIAENAYRKAIERYTLKHFTERYLCTR
jgi:spore maturation protein CgeB